MSDDPFEINRLWHKAVADKEKAEAELAEAKKENERLQSELAEANKSANRWYEAAMGVGTAPIAKYKELQAKNERLVKHNKTLTKIREAYDEHLRLCPQKSREKFRRTVKELKWYGNMVEIACDRLVPNSTTQIEAKDNALKELVKDRGRRARAVTGEE